jgi:hypothetical protein
VNSTLALTLMLLSLMFSAVIVSASWGYGMGRDALKGITQPDVRPTSDLNDTSDEPPRREDLVIIPEEKILEDVRARMNGQSIPDAQTPGQ